MSKITKSQQGVLNDVFAQSNADKDVRDRVIADLRQHGRIRDSYEAWRGLLSKCGPALANNARVEIPIEDKGTALANATRRFSSDAAEASQPAAQPAVASQPEKEPSVRIDESAANAWLDAIGVAGLDRIGRLTPEQRDSLARVAARNRRMAQQLVRHETLTLTTSLDAVLDQLRPLMLVGIHSWANLFNDSGLFNNNAAIIKGSLAVLHYASNLAQQSARLGLPMQILSVDNDVPWDLLPHDLRTNLRRRYEGYLESTDPTYDRLAQRAVADVVLAADLVVDVAYVGKDKTAFATPESIDSPARYVRQQLYGFQLLAIAKKIGARGVELMLYGNKSVDQSWTKRMIKTAREMGIGFVIRHTNGHETEWVDGQIGQRAASDRKRIKYTIPALRPPKQTRMPQPTHSAAVESSDAKDATNVRAFNEALVDAAAAGGDLADWAGRLHRARRSPSTPGSLKRLLEDLLSDQAPRLSAEEALKKLHEAVSDETMELFRALDEIEGQADTMEQQLAEMRSPTTLEDVKSAQETISDLLDRFGDVSAAARQMPEAWDALDSVVFLAHPRNRDDVFSGTAQSVVDDFGATYLEAEERLKNLEPRLKAREIEFSQLAFNKADEQLAEEAQTLIENANKQIDAYAGAVHSAKKEARARFDLFDSFDARTSEGRSGLFAELSKHHDAVTISDKNPGTALASQIDAMIRRLDVRRGGLDAEEPYRLKLDGLKSSLIEARKSAEHAAAEGYAFARFDSQKWKEIRSRATHIENQLEIPSNAPLPLPVEIKRDRTRYIEGKGILRFVSHTRHDKFSQATHAAVIESFKKPGVLVVEGRAFLVSSDAAKALTDWRKERTRDISGFDLLGRHYQLPAHSWGMRIANLDAMPPGHVLRRITEAVNYLYGSKWFSFNSLDFVSTLATNADKPGVGEIWRTQLATLLRYASFGGENGKALELCYPVTVDILSGFPLGLYEQIDANSILSPQASRWFAWGEDDAEAAEGFRPIPEGTAQRIDEMSIDEMNATIEAMNLIPADPLSRQAWIKEWTDVSREYFRTWKKRSRSDADKAKWERRIKGIAALPIPYLLTRVLAEKRGKDFLMYRRFESMEGNCRDAALAQKKPWDETARCRFALHFLYDHQFLIARRLSTDYMDSVEEFDRCTSNGLYSLISGKPQFKGHSPEHLMNLGRAYLSRQMPAITGIMPDAGFLIMGRLLEFGDDLLVSDFLNELKFTMRHLFPSISTSADADADEESAYLSPAEELSLGVLQYWNECEGLLDLRPAVTTRTARFVESFNKSKGCGSGQECGLPAAQESAVGGVAPVTQGDEATPTQDDCTTEEVYQDSDVPADNVIQGGIQLLMRSR